ncbi:MAG: hypothetical protein NVSMB9_29090 [Isosphaeraceae bacterium]
MGDANESCAVPTRTDPGGQEGRTDPNLHEGIPLNARTHWIASLARWFSRPSSRHPVSPNRPRLARAWNFSPLVPLERREVLSLFAPAPIASLPGHFTTSGQPAHVAVRFNPGQITPGKSGSVFLGLVVKPAPGSTASPKIADVTGPSGRLQYSVDKTATADYIIRVTPPKVKPTLFTVNVVAQDDKVGDFVVDAFLPGDVNADGTVNDADLQRIKASYASNAGQPSYDPAADLNQDGHVGCFDKALATANLGASAAIVPEYTAPPPAPVPAPTPAPFQATLPLDLPPVASPTVIQPAPVLVAPVSAPLTLTTPPVATPVFYTNPPTALAQPALVYYPSLSYAPPQGPIPLYSLPPQYSAYPQAGQGPSLGYLPAMPQGYYAPAPPTVLYGQAVPSGSYAVAPRSSYYQIDPSTAFIPQVQPVTVAPLTQTKAPDPPAPPSPALPPAEPEAQQKPPANPHDVFSQQFPQGPAKPRKHRR